MAKIAVELERALAQRAAQGSPGTTTSRTVARGDGWSVANVMCTSGPQDRAFEEQHSDHVIALVLAGTFQYRSAAGHGVLTPGSLMLGNRGQCFECGHEHGHGDRCLAFWYAPDYFERLAADARVAAHFAAPRLPALRALAPLVARAELAVAGSSGVAWEEFGITLAVRALTLASGASPGSSRTPPNATARVTRIVRSIERHPDAGLTLGRLARAAGLSPYHFLRTFARVTGVTPHHYVLRARLRAAALRLATEPGRIVDVALECGFGDVSNFNHAFRAEFGVAPGTYRRVTAGHDARITS